MNIRYPVVTALALALAACGGPEEAAEPPADDTALAPEPNAAPDPATPQGFVELAASSDMYEIEAGRLAQEMGQRQDIKTWGARMWEATRTRATNSGPAGAQS